MISRTESIYTVLTIPDYTYTHVPYILRCLIYSFHKIIGANLRNTFYLPNSRR